MDRREAIVTVLRRDNRLLVIQRSPEARHPGYWAPLSGKLERGETQEEAVVREVHEEVGLTVTPRAKVCESVTGDGEFRLHWWTAETEPGEVIMDPVVLVRCPRSPEAPPDRLPQRGRRSADCGRCPCAHCRISVSRRSRMRDFSLWIRGNGPSAISQPPRGRCKVDDMFEYLLDGDMDGLDAAAVLTATAASRALREQLETRDLQRAQHFADLHVEPGPGRKASRGGQRYTVYGGAGCPAIAEFAIAEFGAMLGVSSISAGRYIGEALALRHRLPRTWAQVLSGHATPWKACKIATACLALSEEAAAIVDRKVASIINTVTPIRLKAIVDAALWTADPDAARAAAEAGARSRGVWVGRSDEHGTTLIWARAATGDVIRFNATIREIADALQALGDTDTLAERSAKALGILSDPALAHELIQVARHLAKAHTTGTSPTPGTGTEAAAGTDASAGKDAAASATDDAGAAAGSARRGTDHSPHDTTGSTPADQSGEADQRGGPHQSGGVDQSDGADQCGEVDGDWYLAEEPGADDDADRDAPHPSSSDLPDPLDAPTRVTAWPWNAADEDVEAAHRDAEHAEPRMDAYSRRALAGRLATIKKAAYSTGLGAGGRSPGKVVLYAHLTDTTLATGEGIVRVEGIGPQLASQLTELLGHNDVILKPVIDLNDKLSVDAYEIPDRIREHVKLTHPVEQFPFGTATTTMSTDLDHIDPYDR
ncbi:NUDIX domain-containing protein, partial [Pseudonocardia sp.]|uniref:NUDIX domain-containing protein n=1 Tax=Pseudonocardia sp. TaxID=60912 RepID=UPI0031FD39FE